MHCVPPSPKYSTRNCEVPESYYRGSTHSTDSTSCTCDQLIELLVTHLCLLTHQHILERLAIHVRWYGITSKVKECRSLRKRPMIISQYYDTVQSHQLVAKMAKFI